MYTSSIYSIWVPVSKTPSPSHPGPLAVPHCWEKESLPPPGHRNPAIGGGGQRGGSGGGQGGSVFVVSTKATANAH